MHLDKIDYRYACIFNIKSKINNKFNSKSFQHVVKSCSIHYLTSALIYTSHLFVCPSAASAGMRLSSVNIMLIAEISDYTIVIVPVVT